MLKRLMLAGLASWCSLGAAEIWVAGEAAAESSARPHGWYDSVKEEALSGGKWLGHFSKEGEAVMRYRVAVPEAGDYTLWLRANPAAGARLSWQLGEPEWREVDFSGALNQVNVAGDGKVDLRFLAWVKAGKVALEAGERDLRVKFHSANQHHGALDCFLLTTEDFVPNGKLQPGEKLGLADEGMWAFEPGPDGFSAEAELDLSDLNEEVAGQAGFVRMREDGELMDGAGKPVRFWAMTTGVHYQTEDPAVLRRHAKWLAKRGVNMVRSHSHLLSKGKEAKATEIDRAEIARIQRLVAAMREEGIYTTISPYWGTHTKWRESLGLLNPDNDSLAGLLFWDENLQAAYKGWWRELLLSENPYTGVPLGRDPAVGLLQLQNEDSLLFYTLQRVQGEARADLRRKFAGFLEKKYGSLAEAEKAWGGARHKNDGEGERGLYLVWDLTQEAQGAKGRRMADQVEFYGRLMFDFNTEMARFLREELGCEHLINAGNWRTADAAKLGDVERWSYTANEVVAVNRYFNGGTHVNPNEKGKQGWAITAGDRFDSASVLRQPGRFPLAVKQPVGRAFMITESSWVGPLQEQSEGPFLVAAYGSLIGLDGFYWFTTGEAEFAGKLGKWQANTPMLAGQFPAAALLFRRGDVEKGEAVLREHRSLGDLWARKKPLALEESGYDPNRDEGEMNELTKEKSELSPLGYLAGPVEVVYESEAERSEWRDFAVKNGVVESLTGELRWDTREGVCVLDSPRAQGATGALAGGELALSALSLRVKNDYATVLAVSLDGKALEASERVLLQLGTFNRPYGWRTKDLAKGKEIVSLGDMPWNVGRLNGELGLRNEKLRRALVLDGNFMKTGELPIVEGVLKLPEDALYLILTP
ncbi:MAG: hypothetical protein ACQKBY_02115 [Verrucomicrobiales bacterium]